MGQDLSKPEGTEGRSRSVSPLPRYDDPLAREGLDDMGPCPSTMPVLQIPDPLGKRRRRRSCGLSADFITNRSRSSSLEVLPPNGTKPTNFGVLVSPPANNTRPGTQPAFSISTMQPQSARRRPANVTVTLEYPAGVPLDKATLIEEYEARRRRSPGAPSPFAQGRTEQLTEDGSPRPRRARQPNNEDSAGLVKTEPSDDDDDDDDDGDDDDVSMPEAGRDAHIPARERALNENVSRPPSTPPVSSLGSAESRQSVKRKPKLPYSPREEERNAEAFDELPHDDAVASPPPRPVRRARTPALTVSRKAKRQNQPQQRRGMDSGVEESDHGEPSQSSQYRSGPLSETEQDKIKRAVERFRGGEGMTEQQLNLLIHENPQKTSTEGHHRQFWSSIQNACPTRPRRKLIEWCRQHFHNFAGRGVWTKEQDDELAELFEVHGKKWSVIGGLINRHQKDVRDRWRNYLVCRDNVKTDAWSDDEEVRFRDLVESSIEKIRERLGKDVKKSPEELINWLTISEAMGRTRSRLQCMEKWKRMRADEPIAAKVPTVLPPGSSWRLQKARKDLQMLTPNDKYTLMRAIRDSGAGTESKLPWKEIVAGTFGGKYERQALVVTWGRLRQAVPNWEWKTTRECARYLCDMYEKEGNSGTLERSDPAAESEHAERTITPATKKRSKGKRAVSSAVAASSGSDTDRPAETKPRKKSAVKKRRDSRDAMGSDEPPKKRRKGDGSATHSAESTPNDTAMDDQALPVPQASSVERSPRSAVRNASPELGITAEPQNSRQIDGNPSPEVRVQASQSSPTVDAQEARKQKKKERRASSVLKENATHGKEKVLSTVKSTPTKVTKRPRRESLPVGDLADPSPKKRRTSGGLKVNGIQSKRESLKAKSSAARNWSEMSSDMDDMEDIPATLPTSSQAAR